MKLNAYIAQEDEYRAPEEDPRRSLIGYISVKVDFTV